MEMMIKKILPWFVFSALIILIIIGLASKDKLNSYLSESMASLATPDIINSGTKTVDHLYNYSENGLEYQVTFLEIGAKGCSACRKMEKVMEEITDKYPQKVNTVFLNILKPENQNLMKYFGVVEIPTQILLNREGKEVFRHSGYIPVKELEQHIIKHF